MIILMVFSLMELGELLYGFAHISLGGFWVTKAYVTSYFISRVPTVSPGCQGGIAFLFGVVPSSTRRKCRWVKTHGLGRTSSGYNLLCHCDATVMRTAPAARVPMFPEGEMLVMTLLSHIAVPTTPLTRFHLAKLRMSSHLDIGLRHFHFKHPASS